MTRVEAYHILGEMYNETFSAEQAQALSIAQDDIEFVDLMPNDMVAVVRCKDCKHHHYICPSGFLDRKSDDFCSYGERRNDVL